MPPPDGPVERIRARARTRFGDPVADLIPRRYTRLGRVLVVPLPEELRPDFDQLGAWYADELSAETVLRPRGPVGGEHRAPDLEIVHGRATETEVLEHGSRYRFDAARVMFARGNKTERARVAAEVRPGEQVVDLFAGIGYFTVPIARRTPTVHVTAVERNPVSYRYLVENLTLNHVADRVRAIPGDNREVAVPGDADRIVLGYLPSSLPWLDRALALLRPDGGSLHVHLVVDARAGPLAAETEVRRALETRGATVLGARPRIVKAYGPGRAHAVVDCRVRPAPPGRSGNT